MPDAAWQLPVLFVVVVELIGLLLLALACVVQSRRIHAFRNQTERRFDELTLRLRLLESRSERHALQQEPASEDPKRMLGSSPRSELSGSGKPLIRPSLITVPDLGVDSQPPDHNLVGQLEERHGEILALQANGLSELEIARRTGQPIGEVEVILALHRRVHATRGTTDHARSG
jgi:hypothetical protein